MKFKNLYAKLENLDWIKLFYILFSFSIIAKVYADYTLGRIGIHSGVLFPYRNFFSLKPYPLNILAIEWAMALIGALLILINRSRLTFFLIALSFSLSLTQMFQHQKVLFLITSISLLIRPLDIKNPDSLKFLRNQVIIIYIYSVIMKGMTHSYNGESLLDTLTYAKTISDNTLLAHAIEFIIQKNLSALISTSILIVEFLIPIALIFRPSLGIFAVALLHLILSAFLPNVFPFSLLMISLSILFVIKLDFHSAVE